jgi:hypothetical protein
MSCTAPGEIAGLRCRLDDGGQPGEQRRRQLLQHAPYREIERVDVQRRAFQRHAQVLSDEAAALREPLQRTIDIDTSVRQLARPLAGVHEQRADAAIDIDPRVGFGGAGGVRERVELILVVGQEARQSLDERGALVKSEAAQVGPPHLAGVRQHELRVEAVGGRVRDDLTRRGIAQCHPGARPGEPPAGNETLQLHGAHSSLTTCPSMR